MRTPGNATIAEKIGSRSHIDFELGIRNIPAANALPACEFGPRGDMPFRNDAATSVRDNQ